MKAIIVCTSVSHGNTKQVADVLGAVLEAPVVHPDQVDTAELVTYDLVGFGSGIFNMSFHPQLRRFVRELPKQKRTNAFVFCTSGFPEPWFRRYTRGLTRSLEQSGFHMVGIFSCRGFDTWLPLKLVGGINKGRPDATDLAAARTFAEGLRARMVGELKP